MKNVVEAWVQNGTSGVLWWTDKMIFPASEMPSHSQLSQINQSNRTKSVYSLNYTHANISKKIAIKKSLFRVTLNGGGSEGLHFLLIKYQ